MRTTSIHRRRGIAVVEVSAASLVLVVCFALLAQLLYLIARQERSAEIRGIATRTAANQLEALLAKEWKDLTAQEPTESAAPPQLAQHAPSAIVTTSIAAEDDGASKQIRVEVSWRSAGEEPTNPVSLTAWKHRPAAEAQP